MGGTMQPQGHAQVMVRIADYGQSPQAACDGPRFRFVQGMDVSVEDDASRPATLEELQRRGHRIVTVDDYNQFGCAQLDLEARRRLLHRQRPAARRAGRRVLNAEDLGPGQLGQREEGAVGRGGARPEVRAHRRRHAVRRRQDARVPEDEPELARADDRRRRLRAVGVARDRALPRGEARHGQAMAGGSRGARRRRALDGLGVHLPERHARRCSGA